ncbi:hypothetical protein F5Y14DRAFT_62835 [Nemania sp. NC0429]|nr:hypothetical protein F5Y14DRAFT_62835 [Nemania sp. NC0429]
MRWLLNNAPKHVVRPLRPRFWTRPLSTIASDLNDAGRVSVPVGSSGNVHIDLYNLGKISSTEPLLVYLPPSPTAASTGGLTRLPKFAQPHATAVIHYRWTASSADEESQAVHERFTPGWPAPLHDTLKAYTWVVENLAPTDHARRDIYVYGSYLGATLAASLALTESRPHERMAVRGCVAYNGIYDWTMFLPDHPINKPPAAVSRNLLEEILSHSEDSDFQELKKMSRELFNKPGDFFDPFASPCLFFRTPGLLIPPSFDDSAIPSPAVLADLLWASDEEKEVPAPPKQPRKRWVDFPPLNSSLKIPDMLILHDIPPSLPPSFLRRRQRRKKNSYGNSFQAQAKELASLMRKSVNKIELVERMRWDESLDEDNDLADRRVQVHDVGVEGHGAATAAWLEERMQ